MRASSANKDFKIGDRLAGLHPSPVSKDQQEQADADRTSDPPRTLVRTEHNMALADRVEGCDGSDVREHVQDLLV